MDPDLGGGYPPPPNAKASSFHALITTLGKDTKSQPSHLVKKLDSISEVPLLVSTYRHMALTLAKYSLISQCTRIWPSPGSMAIWVQKN